MSSFCLVCPVHTADRGVCLGYPAMICFGDGLRTGWSISERRPMWRWPQLIRFTLSFCSHSPLLLGAYSLCSSLLPCLKCLWCFVGLSSLENCVSQSLTSSSRFC